MRALTGMAFLCASFALVATPGLAAPPDAAQTLRYARGTQAGLRALERAFVQQQFEGFVADPALGAAVPGAVAELVPDFGFAPNASLGIVWSIAPADTPNSAWLCARLTTNDAAALRGFLQGAHAAGAYRVAPADCRTRTNVWQSLPTTVAVVRPVYLVEPAAAGTSVATVPEDEPAASGSPPPDAPAHGHAGEHADERPAPGRVDAPVSRAQRLRALAARERAGTTPRHPHLPTRRSGVPR
jgi:hypothetical protein